MTYPEAKYLQFILNRLTKHYQALCFWQNLTWLFTCFLAFLLIFVCFDHAYGVGDSSRILFGVWLYGSLLLFLVFYLIRPLFSPWNPLYTAYTLEQNYPEFQNRLISFHTLLPEDIRAKILSHQSSEILGNIDLETPYRKEHSRLLLATSILSLFLITLGFYGFFSQKSVLTSIWRAMLPGRAISAPTRTQILSIQPGNCILARGETLPISVSFEAPLSPDQAFLFYSEKIGSPLKYQKKLTLVESGFFEQTIGPLYQDISYRIQIDDATSEVFTVNVLERPVLESFTMQVTPPSEYGQASYLQEEPYLVPENSQIILSGKSSKSLKSGVLELERRQVPLQIQTNLPEADEFSVSFTAQESTSFSFVLLDKDGLINQPQFRYTLKVYQENAPELLWIEPATDIVVYAHETIPLKILVNHSLGVQSLSRRIQKGTQQFVQDVWTATTEAPKELLFPSSLAIDEFALNPGESISVSFEAKSSPTGTTKEPKTGHSEPRILTFQKPSSNYSRLMSYLEKQSQSGSEESSTSKNPENKKASNSDTQKSSSKKDSDSQKGTSDASKNPENKKTGNSDSQKNGSDSQKNGSDSQKNGSDSQKNGSNSQKQSETTKNPEGTTKNSDKKTETTSKNSTEKNNEKTTSRDSSSQNTESTDSEQKNKNDSSSKSSAKSASGSSGDSSSNQNASENQENEISETSSSASGGTSGGGSVGSNHSEKKEPPSDPQKLWMELSKQLLQGQVEESLLKQLGLTEEEFQTKIREFQSQEDIQSPEFEAIFVTVQPETNQLLSGEGTDATVGVALDKVEVKKVFDQFQGKVPKKYQSLVKSYFQRIAESAKEKD